MTDRSYDLNAWLDTYALTAFSKAQQDWLKTLERFAIFNYAVAGDVLEASLAQARATLGTRAALGTQALAAEVQESVGSFAQVAAQRAKKAA